MLIHPALDLMRQFGLADMARAFEELVASSRGGELDHAEWLALLLNREYAERKDRRLKARPRYTRLGHHAAVENVNYRTPRGLDRTLFENLALGGWITERQNLIIEGPTGVGKSGLACAQGHKACRNNRSVLYQRGPSMFADLALARGDSRYARPMRAPGGVKMVILNDWGLERLGTEPRRDLMEVVEEHYGRGATLITSQLPVDRWHALIGDPTMAESILDRIVHTAHRLQVRGESLRNKKAQKAHMA